MPCSAVTLSLATITSIIAVALLTIAFATDNWLYIEVKRSNIKVRKSHFQPEKISHSAIVIAETEEMRELERSTFRWLYLVSDCILSVNIRSGKVGLCLENRRYCLDSAKIVPILSIGRISFSIK